MPHCTCSMVWDEGTLNCIQFRFPIKKGGYLMFLKVPLKGSPFPISSISIQKSSFRNNLTQTIVKGAFADGGLGSGYNVKNALYSGIGEYLERITQIKPSHKLKSPYLDAYNISTERIEKIPIENVLIFDSNVFYADTDFKWNDSSGTAFHLYSYELLESSFSEFIERQSLVYNWLTKSPGKKIDLNRIGNDYFIKRTIQTLNGYFNKIELFDISIHPYCHVVLTIGTGDYCKMAGLGAGWNLSKAVFSSVKETLQSISTMIPSHLHDINPDLLEHLNRGPIPKPKDKYSAHFQKLSTEEFQEEFSYLSKGYLKVNEDLSNKYKPSHKNYLSVLKEISKDLNIELLICYIPSIIDNIPGSVVRIMGKGAFPHIKSDEFDPYDFTIKNIDKLPIIKIPNWGRMIAFN